MVCESGEEHGNFTCLFVPENLEGSVGTENRTLNLTLVLKYNIDIS